MVTLAPRLLLPIISLAAVVYPAGAQGPGSTPPKAYKDFTIVSQPGIDATPSGISWGAVVVGIPQDFRYQVKSGSSQSASGREIGRARITDSTGHSVDLGPVSPPRGRTSTLSVSLPRGYSWKWVRPILELDLNGNSVKRLPLHDLPPPESVRLPSPALTSSIECEAIPNLREYHIFGGEHEEPGLAAPGFLIRVHQGESVHDKRPEVWQMVLRSTSNALGLYSHFSRVDDPPGSTTTARYVPFKFAETTDKVQIDIRRIKMADTVQEISIPGCRLVSKFGATGFQLDRSFTFRSKGGWLYTLPVQYTGPFRQP